MRVAVSQNENNSERPNSILKNLQNSVIHDLGGEAVAYLPSRDTLGKRLRYRHDIVSGLLDPCHDYEAMKTEDFPENLRKTVDGGDWLRYNERKVASMEGRIIIFISDHGIKMLKESKIWLCDGTFKVR